MSEERKKLFYLSRDRVQEMEVKDVQLGDSREGERLAWHSETGTYASITPRPLSWSEFTTFEVHPVGTLAVKDAEIARVLEENRRNEERWSAAYTEVRRERSEEITRLRALVPCAVCEHKGVDTVVNGVDVHRGCINTESAFFAGWPDGDVAGEADRDPTVPSAWNDQPVPSGALREHRRRLILAGKWAR